MVSTFPFCHYDEMKINDFICTVQARSDSMPNIALIEFICDATRLDFAMSFV